MRKIILVLCMVLFLITLSSLCSAATFYYWICPASTEWTGDLESLTLSINRYNGYGGKAIYWINLRGPTSDWTHPVLSSKGPFNLTSGDAYYDLKEYWQPYFDQNGVESYIIEIKVKDITRPGIVFLSSIEASHYDSQEEVEYIHTTYYPILFKTAPK